MTTGKADDYTFGTAGAIIVGMGIFVLFILSSIYAYSSLSGSIPFNWGGIFILMLVFIVWIVAWCFMLSAASPVIMLLTVIVESVLQIVWRLGRYIGRRCS